jgi:hypothetical protein
MEKVRCPKALAKRKRTTTTLTVTLEDFWGPKRVARTQGTMNSDHDNDDSYPGRDPSPCLDRENPGRDPSHCPDRESIPKSELFVATDESFIDSAESAESDSCEKINDSSKISETDLDISTGFQSGPCQPVCHFLSRTFGKGKTFTS